MMPSVRRITVVVTLLLQVLVIPATAQIRRPRLPDLSELPKKIGTQVISDAALWAAAKTLGIKDPVAERRITPEELEDSRSAKRVFDSAYSAALEETFEPTDPENVEHHARRFRQVIQRIKSKKSLTDSDLSDSAAALLPFIRYAVSHDQSGPNSVTVWPGQVRRVTFQTYCMDHDAPAPRPDERIRLVRSERVIPPHGREIYTALMEHSAKNPAEHSSVQNLLWGMRHARAEAPFLREMSAAQSDLLNRAMPGGVERFQRFLNKEMQSGRVDSIKTKIYQRAVARLERSLGTPLPPPSRVGYSVRDVDSALLLLESAAVTEGTLVPDTEYTLLAPGVAVRAVSGTVGVRQTQFELLNASCAPYTLNGADFVGQSTRLTQRIALGGVVKPESGKGLSPLAGALDSNDLTLLERKLTATFGTAGTAAQASGWTATRLALGRALAVAARRLIQFHPAGRAIVLATELATIAGGSNDDDAPCASGTQSGASTPASPEPPDDDERNWSKEQRKFIDDVRELERKGESEELRVIDPAKSDRIPKQYGGELKDWVKMTSKEVRIVDGKRTQIHYFRNKVTGQAVEFEPRVIDK